MSTNMLIAEHNSSIVVAERLNINAKNVSLSGLIQQTKHFPSNEHGVYISSINVSLSNINASSIFVDATDDIHILSNGNLTTPWLFHNNSNDCSVPQGYSTFTSCTPEQMGNFSIVLNTAKNIFFDANSHARSSAVVLCSFDLTISPGSSLSTNGMGCGCNNGNSKSYGDYWGGDGGRYGTSYYL